MFSRNMPHREGFFSVYHSNIFIEKLLIKKLGNFQAVLFQIFSDFFNPSP